jgi:hypothetical protein
MGTGRGSGAREVLGQGRGAEGGCGRLVETMRLTPCTPVSACAIDN